MNNIHFISGLPRSGSSLLAAILRQNPRFTASIRSPLEDLSVKVIRCASSEFSSMLPVEKSAALIRSLFDTYYAGKDVVFDTNRAWLLRDDLLSTLFPGHKMILCVRNIADILNSFEHLHKKNPLTLTAMYDEQFNKNVFTRCGILMADGGSVASAYQALKQYITAVDNPFFLLEYDALAGNPRGSIKKIYDYLGEEYFDHDFDDVESSNDEFDAGLRTPGLHTTRKKVELIRHKMLLPDNVVQQFSGLEFWSEGKAGAK